MSNVLRYRLYQLRCQGRFWQTAAILVMIAAVLSRFHLGTADPAGAFLCGIRIRDAGTATAEQTQYFSQLARSLSATGELFLVPSVICGFLGCEDLSRKQLTAVISNGYARRGIQWAELLCLSLIQLAILGLVRGIDMAIYWTEYRQTICWLGPQWLLAAMAFRFLFSLGNLAAFLLITAHWPRPQPLLTLGLACTALDVLEIEPFRGILLLFPSGGLRTLFYPTGWPLFAIYLAQTVILWACAWIAPRDLPKYTAG